MASSMSYEIIEWLFTLIAAPEQGMSFLGTQGDEWDAQKDMALATAGAVLACWP
jgi:putative membrane protein